MNIDKMTTQERRDWLARDEGWYAPMTNPQAPGALEWTKVFPEYPYLRPCGWGKDDCKHPIPDTLDAAAKALPDGWMWVKCWAIDETDYLAVKYMAYGVDDHEVIVPDTGDEKHDRFVLAIAARMAMKKGAAQ